MTATELFTQMYENYANGNLSDFKRQVSRLTKIQCFAFVQYLQGYAREDWATTSAVVNYLARQSSLN